MHRSLHRSSRAASASGLCLNERKDDNIERMRTDSVARLEIGKA